MKKEKLHPILKILIGLFVLYVILFSLSKSGYYDKKIRDKTAFTEKQIAQFESDVANGLEVDIEEYLPKEEDYSNALTKGANAISRRLSKILTNNSKNIVDFLKALFIGK